MAIFRKSNDSSDEELDSDDDGGPIYIDETIKDLNEFTKPMTVHYILF